MDRREDWSYQDLEVIKRNDIHLEEMAKLTGRSVDAVRQKRYIERQKARIKPSPYPSYNEPLHITGNVLVLPDVEAPFHNADFLNRVVDLAMAWKVESLLAAGDLFHLGVMSGWQPNWSKVVASYMDEDTKDALIDLFNALPKDKRSQGFEILEKCEEKTDSSFADEVRACKKVVNAFGCFNNKYHIMGNHEGRLLSALNSGLEGQNIRDLFGMDGWQMSEYYFAEVISNGEKFRVAHPKTYGKNAPADMASRFLCHYLMGHSHDWSQRFDRSGKFFAIAMGHCADESKFPYEAQRDRMYWAHVPGAVIIRDGFPWLLSENTPWKLMEKM
jgi:hypothetical protein